MLSNLTIGARILVVPLYAAHLGQSTATIGLLYASFAGVAALTSATAGFIIDRQGSREILVVGLAISSGAQVLTISTSLAVIFVSQILAGVAFGIASVSIITAALKAAAPRQLGRVMGKLTLGNQTGLMAGPALAGALIGSLGFHYVFVLAAIPPALGLLVTHATLQDTPPQLPRGSAKRRTHELIRRPATIAMAILAVSIGVVWGIYSAYFAIFASQGVHLNAIQVGTLFAIGGLSNALARIPGGRLLDRVASTELVAILAVVSFGVGLLALPRVGGFWPIAMLLILSMPLISLAIMGCALVAAALGATDARGRMISIMTSMVGVGSAIAPVLLAHEMDRSFIGGFSAAGMIGIACAVVALLLRGRNVLKASEAIGAANF